MINSDDGKIIIKGDLATVMTDMTFLIKTFVKNIGEKYYAKCCNTAMEILEDEKKKNANRAYEERKGKRRNKWWSINLCRVHLPYLLKSCDL